MSSSTLSSDNFKTLIEDNADGILVVSRTGQIRYVNQAAQELLCHSSCDLLGRTLGVPVTPGKRTEIDLVCGDLNRVAEMRVVLTEWEGEPCYLASLRDVTERKRAEAALQFLSEASRQLGARAFDPSSIVETAGCLALQHLADWCLIDLVETEDFVRRKAMGSRSCKVGELGDLEGTYLRADAVHAKQGPLHVLFSRECEVHKKVTPAVIESLCLSPEHRSVLESLCARAVMSVPILGSGRELRFVGPDMVPESEPPRERPLGVITFILTKAGHSYRRDERTLAQDLAQRVALALENARLYEQASKGVHRRDQFLAMLGHELRNPLAPILTAAQALRARSEDTSPESAKALRVIERQAQHLIRLVDDLLDLSRVSRGRIQLRLRETSIHPLIDDAIQASRSWIESCDQHLHLHREHRELLVKGDPTRLTQVIVNLLNNASRYTPKGGRIDLRVTVEKEDVVIKVKDSGVGIPPQMLRRIFDPFVQLDDQLDRAEGGMGIGLALVQRLVQLHGGRVSATSPGQGQGSEMIVRLPKVESKRVRKSTEPAPKEASSSRLRILLVEDKLDAREMLRDLLELWGHEVREAADGRQGLNVLCSWRPDVALIDIGLPELNGYEVAQKGRAIEGGLSSFLVALTGYGQESDRQRALEAGFDAHIVKPVDMDRLSTLLSTLTRDDSRIA